MSPFNQPKGMVAYGDMKVMLKPKKLLYPAYIMFYKTFINNV